MRYSLKGGPALEKISATSLQKRWRGALPGEKRHLEKNAS